MLVRVVTGEAIDLQPVTTQTEIDALNAQAQRDTEGALFWVSLAELGKLHAYEACVEIGGTS